MNIDHLREFTTIASSASLNDASAKLFVSPSTLSKHLAAIEETVGIELFNRSTSSFEMTRAGEKFLEYAMAICELYDKALTVPQLVESGPPTVMVGGHLQCSYFYRLFMAASSLAAHYAEPVSPIPLFSHYTGAMPALSKINPLHSLGKGACDISLVFTSREDELDDFESTTIGRERYSIAVAPDHPLAQHGPYIDIEALESYRITVSQAYPAIWQRFEDYCQNRGFAPTWRRRTFQSGGEMLSAHDGNELMLLLRKDAPRVAPQSVSGLVVRDLEDGVTIPAIAVWRKDDNTQSVRDFVNCIQKSAALLELEESAESSDSH